MKMISKIFLCLLGMAMLTVFSACESEDYGTNNVQETVYVDDIKVSVESVDFVMGVNNSTTLAVVLSPSTVTPQDLIWTSSNPSVVSVDNSGVLTAFSDGEAIITISSQDRSVVKTCNVKVSHVKLSTMKLNINEYQLQEGGELTLSVTKEPNNAYFQNISWRSTDTSVAVVDNGNITAVRAGKVDIIASCLDGLEDTCHVTVLSNTGNVTFKPYEKVEW